MYEKVAISKISCKKILRRWLIAPHTDFLEMLIDILSQKGI